MKGDYFRLERNRRIIEDKLLHWSDRLESAHLKAFSLWSLSKSFAEFSLHDIYLNWHAFIVPL